MASSCESKEDGVPELIEIESVCLNCYKTGTTRLLLTKIPFFRDVVISSFSCPHCGFENRLLDPAAAIQDYGQRIELKVMKSTDLNRRIVRPSGSVVCIPELDASFPSADGDLSTVEGVLEKIIENIRALQPERKKSHPELAEKLDQFINRMVELMRIQQPFTVVLDDPSGNGCIENPLAPAGDPQLSITQYERTLEQNAALGYAAPTTDTDNSAAQNEDEAVKDTNGGTKPEDLKDEILGFKVTCSHCNAPSDIRMKVVAIPHFKEVVIMANVCQACGFKDSEVKAAGGIAPLGRLYRLKITHPSDLSRDLLVSENAGVCIPELDLESQGGTLGGRFTTLEGFLVAIKEQLMRANPFVFGDSASKEEQGGKLGTIIQKIDQIASGSLLNVTFELKDPTGNSYLQNLYAPEKDPNMEVIDYERSEEEKDFLGLLDMNTADFETVPAKAAPVS